MGVRDSGIRLVLNIAQLFLKRSRDKESTAHLTNCQHGVGYLGICQLVSLLRTLSWTSDDHLSTRSCDFRRTQPVVFRRLAFDSYLSNLERDITYILGLPVVGYCWILRFGRRSQCKMQLCSNRPEGFVCSSLPRAREAS